jgi:hypothetical protein
MRRKKKTGRVAMVVKTLSAWHYHGLATSQRHNRLSLALNFGVAGVEGGVGRRILGPLLR